MTAVPITEQCAEIERELALRRRVYPHWVESGRLGDVDAERQLSRMEAALKTLRWVEKHGEAIKQIASHLRDGLREPTEAERDALMANQSVRDLVEAFPGSKLRLSVKDALDEILEGDDRE